MIRPSDTQKAERFWDFCERTSKHVRATMPDWLTPEQRAAYWAKVDRHEAPHPYEWIGDGY